MQEVTQDLSANFLRNLRRDQRSPVVVLLAALEQTCRQRLAFLADLDVACVQHLSEVVQAEVGVASALSRDGRYDIWVNNFDASVQLPLFPELLPPANTHLFGLLRSGRVLNPSHVFYFLDVGLSVVIGRLEDQLIHMLLG